MAEAPRIALFGGTFDPVHHGHLMVAECARQSLALDEVRFIPCQISPHKQESTPAPVADRLEMLKLATRGMPWATVDDWEARHDGPSYSWKTAEAMKAQNPNAKLFWIMGTDQWKSLPQWDQPQRLAQCVEFIVTSRGEKPEPRDGYSMHALDFDHPATATQIRSDMMKTGKYQHPWLDSKVADWITSHQLYCS